MSRTSKDLLRFCSSGALAILAVVHLGCPGSSPPSDLADLGMELADKDLVAPSDATTEGGGEVGPQPCMDNADCPVGMVCHPESNVCVQCLIDEDCPKGFKCLEWQCVEQIPCADMTCPDLLVCDPETMTCVDCLMDQDCPEGYECKDKTCVEVVKPCSEGGECPPGTVCDMDTNTCVQCLQDGDCPEGSYCDPATKTCEKMLCEPGFTDCVGNAVVVCRDNGGGWDLLQTCPTGWACMNGECIEDCTPDCAGKKCGADGCGGNCGICPDGTYCDNDECIGECLPKCAKKECGDNGCGGVCGTCADDQTCSDGQCLSLMSCAQGIDCLFLCSMPFDACWENCVGQIAPGEEQSQFLKLFDCVTETCKAVPGGGFDVACFEKAVASICMEIYNECVECKGNCSGKTCGPDGCGGSCGTCPAGTYCEEFKCKEICVPQCFGMECGADGCGGVCGSCGPGFVCTDGSCECIPDCAGKVCGSDGCGGSCGSCANPCTGDPDDPSLCLNGACMDVCCPLCGGKECGSDGCGGACGFCPDGSQCENGKCIGVCLPDCFGKQCGPDGCDGSCGSCAEGFFCNMAGHCQPLCVPQCQGKDCGANGCGGACGICSSVEYCDFGVCTPFHSCLDMLDCYSACGYSEECYNQCWLDAAPEAKAQYNALWQCLLDACGPDGSDQCYENAYLGECKDEYYACLNCTPNCTGKDCGPDGCGSTCGTCPGGAQCTPAGLCPCVPGCGGKECGPNGCGGSCGECADDEVCSVWGQCTCIPNCLDKQCGNDGCGGSCGNCPAGWVCTSGECVKICTPQCIGKQCGDDGCGGSCGFCPAGTQCNGGICTDICVPQCFGKECGSDGCGGECGQCKPGATCKAGKCYDVCTPNCKGKECGDDGCGGQCGQCKVGWYCALGECQQECLPNCIGKHCGPNGCGGSCGTCPGDYYCGASGQCLPSCLPQCEGKECGSDSCGGQCGYCDYDENCIDDLCVDFVSCYDILTCNWSCPPDDDACSSECFSQGSPEAQKQWSDLWYCLWDHCGGKPQGAPCWNNALQGPCKNLYYECMNCTPNCGGKQCGPDGCGGLCGECPDGAPCDDAGQCPCQPKCTGKECGPDNCGGLCGTCTEPEICNPLGKCACLPLCEGKECGQDGCGGSCGMCPDNWDCIAGKCQSPCEPQCQGKECGPDGCGGVCGKCGPEEVCFEEIGYCVKQSDGCEPSDMPGCGGCLCEACVCGMDPFCCDVAWDGICVDECYQCGGCGCVPNCTSPDGQQKECGSDGCGGQCGYCPPGLSCQNDMCIPQPMMTCEEGIDCVISCSGDLKYCLEMCIQNVYPDEQEYAWMLGECILNNCMSSNGVIDPECYFWAIEGPCAKEYQMCVGGCFPNCQGKQCGPDGCGGQCGYCPPGSACQNGVCTTMPMMTCEEGMNCVMDCNGPVYECMELCLMNVYPEQQDYAWMLGECVANYCMDNAAGYLDPDCYFWAIQGPCAQEYEMCAGGTQACGPAGPQSCLGNCGGPASGGCYCDDLCTQYGDCCPDYQGCCDGPCVPDCQGKECGDDGCGGSCGVCPEGLPCNDNGQCQDPNQKTCGEAVQCALSCGGLDPGCLTGCLSGASGQSQQLMFDLITCLVQECGFNLDATCIAQAISGSCSSEFSACMAD